MRLFPQNLRLFSFIVWCRSSNLDTAIVVPMMEFVRPDIDAKILASYKALLETSQQKNIATACAFANLQVLTNELVAIAGVAPFFLPPLLLVHVLLEVVIGVVAEIGDGSLCRLFIDFISNNSVFLFLDKILYILLLVMV